MSKLRSASYKWPARNQALINARVERGKYKCAMCNEIFSRDQVQIDHIEPVIGLNGFTTWDDVITRMFPEPEGFQILDLNCHDGKTAAEDAMRAYYNKEKKLVDKKKEKE
jgi:hypothetical protein